MISVAMLLLFASPAEQTTLPRHPDPDLQERQERRPGTPTDPWFDREQVATDDPAFVLTAIESARMGVVDARNATSSLGKPELRAAAEKIEQQNTAVSHELEKLAAAKGWRLPQNNPGRASTVANGNTLNGGSVRTHANFIVNQISYHENTLAHYRAQIAGKGDADLKRALRRALPGYQQNLEMLLKLKP